MTLTNPSQVTTVFDKNIFPLLFVAVRLRKHLKQLLQAGRFTQNDFEQVTNYLKTGDPLPEKYDDHVIKSRKPDRALFIKGSWLLIYRVEDLKVRLLDVGR
ncbi:MAG: type II toxin-antitoxin system YafQ family toxin, partial [Lacticaseibacillus paracasei]|nr:type II toxin-antitoxin system YafQ family toxin [Lacticaseibacillus paracasei]